MQLLNKRCMQAARFTDLLLDQVISETLNLEIVLHSSVYSDHWHSNGHHRLS